MALIPFQPGAHAVITDLNFLSHYDAVMRNVDNRNYSVYGNGRLTGLLDLFGAKTPTIQSKYEWFEKNRIYPKIKATCAGGSANAAVTFSLTSDDNISYTDQDPYIGTVTNKYSVPVVGDQIQIKPASGTVSANTYVTALITAVSVSSGANGEFTAYPIVSGESIPAISSADEIIITGNAYGEGSATPSARSTQSTKRSNNIQIFKATGESTRVANCTKLWFKDDVTGAEYGMIQEEGEQFTIFLDARELGLLTGKNLTNVTLANVYANLSTPIEMTQGLIPSIFSRGNTETYSPITGYTVADLNNSIVTLDQQKGAKRNMWLHGMEFGLQLDDELADYTKNGAITYGQFKGSEEKAIDLGFRTVSKGGYTFQKKLLDAFSDVQSLGASGYGYTFEAMVLPMDDATDASGKKIPPFQLRYLQENGKTSEEMHVEFVDLRKVGDTGVDKVQYRYSSMIGLQAIGMNRTIYQYRG